MNGTPTKYDTERYRQTNKIIWIFNQPLGLIQSFTNMTTVAIARAAGEVGLLGGTVTSSVIAYEKGSALTAAKKRISEMTGDNSEANNAHVQAASDLKEIVNIFHMINNYLVDKHSADIVNIKENDGEQKTLKDRISALNECMKDYLNNKKT